ncbi:uncharacterized protein F5147DRAFT_657963 [Suillus discolor]|uniref:Uncharacterized protein n=1 Tax=Suillus discolor TaxID=1912936 RepID=A0A9P7EVF0_9AGAM|nr:uncharacterized protein F5147DRAFT_657963 [Suillus discolor]KAG2091359.1 hypothetical protein F5147DRAFT_657963 [Suillus discolor]
MAKVYNESHMSETTPLEESPIPLTDPVERIATDVDSCNSPCNRVAHQDNLDIYDASPVFWWSFSIEEVIHSLNDTPTLYMNLPWFLGVAKAQMSLGPARMSPRACKWDLDPSLPTFAAPCFHPVIPPTRLPEDTGCINHSLRSSLDKEILELKNYLPEWTAAKRSEKRAIFTAIARAARLFAPKLDQKQWKKRKQVYKTWLFNNKKKKERKDMIKYGRKWTPRMVVYQQKREEVLKRIEDESGVKPGDPGMFKHYQAAVKRVMAELDDDELEKAKETAEEWSNNCPPPEIQAQVARKKGPAYMEHFSNEMWRQCGMRVFVMSAWKNEKGEVLHDDNKALGNGDSFMKTKDWEDIEPVWQEYSAGTVRLQWHGMEDVRSREVEKEFENQLSNSKWTGREKKAIVRAFLTSHYRICSGKDKAVVPWSAIVQSQDDFVARTYLPADVNLKEPSKLQNWDTTALLHFWCARQETGKGPTFLFKAWKNNDGDMVPSVISGKSPSPQTHIVRKQQRVTIRRPRDSSTEAESDKESATNHTEDDVDDDLADGRHLLKKPRTVKVQQFRWVSGPGSRLRGEEIS